MDSSVNLLVDRWKPFLAYAVLEGLYHKGMKQYVHVKRAALTFCVQYAAKNGIVFPHIHTTRKNRKAD